GRSDSSSVSSGPRLPPGRAHRPRKGSRARCHKSACRRPSRTCRTAARTACAAVFARESGTVYTRPRRLSPLRKKLQPPEVVIVGAGVAGLTAALSAAEYANVLVLAKGALDSSNSWAAQGGVAAAVGPDDDPSLHAADTITAGRGLCRQSAVALLTEEAPTRIAELVRLGVEFDDGLGREGGHSRSRVVHAGGAETGRRIAEVLGARVREHPRIAIAEQQVAD